jgi:hypothetical protein
MADQYELTEVICNDPRTKGSAYGMTFADHSTAAAYARAMRRKGYEADISPSFWTEPDLEAALASAAKYFDDASLTEQAGH